MNGCQKLFWSSPSWPVHHLQNCQPHSFLSFFLQSGPDVGPSEDFLLLFWAFLWVFLSCKMSTSILPGVLPRAKYWESGIRQTCPSQFQWSFSESYACDGIGVILKGLHARWLPQQKEVVWVVPLDVDSRRNGEASPESTSLAQRHHTHTGSQKGEVGTQNPYRLLQLSSKKSDNSIKNAQKLEETFLQRRHTRGQWI